MQLGSSALQIGRPSRFSAVHDPCREDCRALVQAFRLWQAGVEQRRTPGCKRKSKSIQQTLYPLPRPLPGLTDHPRAGDGGSSASGTTISSKSLKKQDLCCSPASKTRIHSCSCFCHMTSTAFTLCRCLAQRLPWCPCPATLDRRLDAAEIFCIKKDGFARQQTWLRYLHISHEAIYNGNSTWVPTLWVSILLGWYKSRWLRRQFLTSFNFLYW